MDLLEWVKGFAAFVSIASLALTIYKARLKNERRNKRSLAEREERVD